MTHELKPLAKWYLGSMNDGLHIQDRPAIGMNDDGPWDMPDGPNIIADVSKLGNRKAQIICDAHNAAVEAWNTRAEAQPSDDVKAQQIVDIFDMHAQFYVDHAGAGKPIKIENAMEVAQKILGLLAPQPSTDVVERVARFQEALEDIAASHVPDQPAESAAEPEVFVRMWVGRLRGIATEALKQQPQESAE